MLIIKDGDEFTIENYEQWLDFSPRQGTVIEIDTAHSDYLSPEENWVGFYVSKVHVGSDGSSFLEVKYLGGMDGDLSKEFSSLFNRKTGHIHLCLGAPCTKPLEAQIHVTRVRTWSVERFQAEYMTPSANRQLRKWAGIPEPGGGKKLDHHPARPSALKRRKPKEGEPGGGELDGEGKDAEVPARTPEVERLRAKLNDLRAKLTSKDPPAKEKAVGSQEGVGDVEDVDSSSPGYAPSSAEEVDPLVTGTMLAPVPVDPKRGATPKGKPRSDKKVKKEKQKKRKTTSPTVKTRKSHGGDHGKDGKGHGALVLALRDSTSRGMQSQLALRAAKEAEERRGRKSHSKKTSNKSLGKQLIELLSGKRKGKRGDGGGGPGRDPKDGSGKDGKKKKKKKKSKGGDDDDSSESLRGGVTVDSDESWASGSSQEESSSSKDRDLDPPLKKKAREKPGSVLKLLLTHARAQLDQTSKVSLAAASDQDVTEGVKMSSYFAICVRPTLGTNLGQMRELHHLSTAIDLLRQGNLTLLGDCLSSRFMAIHQAAVDGSWSAARHMELFPLEDTTAAASSVLLETRKHARLAAKVAGYDVSSWKGAGRGKGGKKGKKGGWDGEEWKGGGKDGKKGKGGDRDKWNKKGDAWKDTKEHPGDKK